MNHHGDQDYIKDRESFIPMAEAHADSVIGAVPRMIELDGMPVRQAKVVRWKKNLAWTRAFLAEMDRLAQVYIYEGKRKWEDNKL